MTKNWLDFVLFKDKREFKKRYKAINAQNVTTKGKNLSSLSSKAEKCVF